MDFANRGNRPAGTPPQPVGQQEQPTQSFQPVNNEKKKSKLSIGKIATIVLLVLTVAIFVASILMIATAETDEGASETAVIQTDKYQALFLDSQDGQVYFGKLAIYNDDLYQLTDIYYVRVENPVQPEGADQASTPQQNISLAKLGNELHGPQDVMYVSRDKVLYWENLKDDGQVVTAITEFKANGEQAPANNNSNNGGAAGTEETETQTPNTP
jgi:hypothetical protein